MRIDTRPSPSIFIFRQGKERAWERGYHTSVWIFYCTSGSPLVWLTWRRWVWHRELKSLQVLESNWRVSPTLASQTVQFSYISVVRIPYVSFRLQFNTTMCRMRSIIFSLWKLLSSTSSVFSEPAQFYNGRKRRRVRHLGEVAGAWKFIVRGLQVAKIDLAAYRM